MPPIWPAGWEVKRCGGLLIASPHRLSDADTDSFSLSRTPAGHIEVLGYVVSSPLGDIRFCNVHLPSPRRGLEPLLDRWTVVRPSESPRLEAITDFRHEQSRIVSNVVTRQYAADVVAGDFNMPVDSYIYRRYWSGLRNAFSMVGWGYGYTKRSEIRGLCYGLRIDHVLTGTNWRPVRCWVEDSIGSDHLPVVTDLVPQEKAGGWRPQAGGKRLERRE
jgi:endonuclease/exonuclease/phosphatase family metal-dependent hydrolase